MSGLVGAKKSIISNQENFTKFPAVIQSDHTYIHAGIGFTAIINTGSISAAYDIGFTTPTAANSYIHWRPLGVDSSSDYVDYILYEGDSWSSGSAVTPINRNRNSSNTTNMQAFAKGVTATPTGTIIQRGGIGASGNPVSRTGGGAAADQEIVLAPNTDYVLTLTPAGATIVNLSLFWYEEGEGA